MEILYRLSVDKFKNLSPSTAIRIMLEESFVPCFGKLNSHKWRIERYWNESVD